VRRCPGSLLPGFFFEFMAARKLGPEDYRRGPLARRDGEAVQAIRITRSTSVRLVRLTTAAIPLRVIRDRVELAAGSSHVR
jgi:hypothetical protein